MSLLQKLIGLCNISVLPTCAVLNIARSATGYTRGSLEPDDISYGKRTLLGCGLEDRKDCEFHVTNDPTGLCLETANPPPMTKTRLRGLQVGQMTVPACAA